MPEYEFRVLCRDGDIVCRSIMDEMRKEFDHVEKLENALNSDHYAVKNFENITKAEEKANELLEKYHNNIRGVTIVPR